MPDIKPIDNPFRASGPKKTVEQQNRDLQQLVIELNDRIKVLNERLTAAGIA